MTTLCTMIGAYVITVEVILPIVNAVDDKLKISETLTYGMGKVMKKLSKKDKK